MGRELDDSELDAVAGGAVGDAISRTSSQWQAPGEWFAEMYAAHAKK